MSFRKFACVDSVGTELGAVTIEHLWAGVFGLRRIKTEAVLSLNTWKDLFRKAQQSAIELRATTLMYRLIEDSDSETIAGLLQQLGFQKKWDRIEYRAAVQNLPSEEGTPIRWQTAAQLGWSSIEVANCFKIVSEGALDAEPTDAPLIFIEDWMQNPVLTCGPQCIEIGFIENQLCALVVAQVNPRTSWSTLSYMSLAPDFRGKRLGQWVHRHGFEMIRAQGGKLYHGGTIAKNSPMIRLFERHECQLHCKMQEWSWTPQSMTAQEKK